FCSLFVVGLRLLPRNGPAVTDQSLERSRLELSRWRGGRFACYAPHVMPQRNASNCGSRTCSFSKYRKTNSLQMGEKIEFPSPLARIRRKRQRLPSSRCIESARTHRARACSLLTRASDTTLRLLDTDQHVANLDYFGTRNTDESNLLQPVPRQFTPRAAGSQDQSRARVALEST